MLDTEPKGVSTMENPYQPNLAVVEKIIEETWDTKTFRAVFQDEALRESFAYEPGQFQLVSYFGVGEATFCLTSTSTRKGYVEFSVKKVGSVTQALHEMSEGEIVGIRAPLGNHFPYEQWKGKNLLFAGGGGVRFPAETHRGQEDQKAQFWRCAASGTDGRYPGRDGPAQNHAGPGRVCGGNRPSGAQRS